MALTTFDEKTTHITLNKAIRFKGKHTEAGESIAKDTFKDFGDWRELVASGAAYESNGSEKKTAKAPAAPVA